ncbi:MAG: triose-phosphate isomerase [Candidatus Paceibacterota bacterium]
MKKLIVGNWKCNPAKLSDAIKIIRGIRKASSNSTKAEVVICPPYVFLIDLIKQAKNTDIKIGAQNCFWTEGGAFTGQISCKMIKNSGCKYVIIGHSEARQFNKETNEEINRKIHSALEEKLLPILCVGENGGERKKGKTFEILRTQITEGLAKINKSDFSKITIAYEPIWAIGTGNFAEPMEMKKAKDFIIGLITKLAGKENTSKIRVLYGGSVKSENARLYFNEARMDGLLVGGASLDPKEFSKIIRSVVPLRSFGATRD